MGPPDFGAEMRASAATLHKFAFPIRERAADSLSVGATGSIRFGAPLAAAGQVRGERRGDRPRSLNCRKRAHAD